MKIKKKIVRYFYMFLCLCCLEMAGKAIYAQEETVIESESINENIEESIEESIEECCIVQAFMEPEIILYDVEKGTLFDLMQQFPTEIDVVLEDGTTVKVEVGWRCDLDYELTNEPSYKFEVVLPKQYLLAEGVEKAFIGVVLKDAYAVNPTVHFDENDNGITLDTYLGATGIVDHLNSHRNDGFYIGTPYTGWSSGTANWVCMTPQGAPYNGWYSGMNCTGFVQYVLQACGGDWTRINTQGNCNLSAWTYAMLYNNLDDQIKVWKFNSKEEMLASEKLMKGDIILMEPTYPGSWSGATDAFGNAIDCHIGFYWGDDSNKDMFWHSSHSTYGLGWTMVDGPVNGSGNQISNITPKCNGNVFYVFPVTHNGYLQIEKTFSGGNGAYNPDADPAYYTIYADAACTIPAETYVGASTFRVESNLKTGEIPIKAGTYYVKETRSPSGWNLDPKVYEIKVTDENTVAVPAKVYSTNTKKVSEGYLKLIKSSANTSVTDGNGNYEISGAIYGVYKDKSCSTKVTQLTTKSDGSSNTVRLNIGTYYVKEITAPTGYVVDTAVYTVKISASHTSKKPYVLELKDQPYVDTTTLDIYKIDASKSANASLPGAKFVIKYYDGYYTSKNLPSEAKRSWTIETKAEVKDGRTVYRAALMDAYKVAGDELYYQGEMAVLPLGTISIEEIQAPVGYTLNGGYLLDENGTKHEGIYVTQITANGGNVSINGGHQFTVANNYITRSITLTKTIDANEVNLANGNPTFIFKLDGTDVSGEKHTFYKMLVFTPEYLSGKTGDVSLSVTFDNLISGTYTASEEPVARYKLSSILNVSGGSITGNTIVFDLVTNIKGNGEFYNKIAEHGWFSGNAGVINSIEISNK